MFNFVAFYAADRVYRQTITSRRTRIQHNPTATTEGQLVAEMLGAFNRNKSKGLQEQIIYGISLLGIKCSVIVYYRS